MVDGLFRVGILNSGMFSGVVRFGSIYVERSEEQSVSAPVSEGWWNMRV